MPSKKSFLSEGIKFQCQGSGKCCTSHGEFGFVFLTLSDRRKIAKFLKITTTEFTKKYCSQRNGFWHLNEDGKNPDCMFLKNKRCEIYSARPTQCRTWPFWPEVLNPKSWKKEVIEFCPGMGKGKIIPYEKWQVQLQEQEKSEEELIKEARGFL
ncbi:MAG: YkgJ family cysteine cluster protein [Bdellovibrionales bacterium]|nr:YkgJ family cysteine cluster protein [Bdellovibrionales bacterium]